ncbi:GlcG/HbpS family heme-binding protein [Tautonia sociabilis]|uniref:Heme-binding protein n=1 Tax=Tautonia sociabilis TaxID=2080755 RepID=A0A432MQT7_9BACT|nr:heme-binding protein [Tautonia sociabilis]RUL89730.1 heme-binding protein [Tautonia sociabilis]
MLARLATISAALTVSLSTAGPATGQEPPPLIERGAIRLTLGGAQAIVEGAQEKAREMGLKVNITVVDEGGHPIAFVRMDGARSASSYTSMTKAVAAATLRQPTGPVPAGVEAPDALLNLSLQLTASASGGKVTTLSGGVPVVVDGQIIGGVGVGGATGEQDAEIARAGIARLLSSIDSQDSDTNGR